MKEHFFTSIISSFSASIVAFFLCILRERNICWFEVFFILIVSFLSMFFVLVIINKVRTYQENIQINTIIKYRKKHKVNLSIKNNIVYFEFLFKTVGIIFFLTIIVINISTPFNEKKPSYSVKNINIAVVKPVEKIEKIEKQKQKSQSDWGKKIVKHIKRGWNIPPGTRGMSAKIRIKILSNGYIDGSIDMVSCNGHPFFCDSVKQAYKDVEPLPKPSRNDLDNIFLIKMD